MYLSLRMSEVRMNLAPLLAERCHATWLLVYLVYHLTAICRSKVWLLILSWQHKRHEVGLLLLLGHGRREGGEGGTKFRGAAPPVNLAGRKGCT